MSLINPLARYASSLLGAALLILAGLAAAPTGAVAADLYDDRPHSAYDDPRYRDMYAHPAPRDRAYIPGDLVPPPTYDRAYDRTYREVPPHPVPPARVYAHERGPAYYGDGCLRLRDIRRTLRHDGWHDFADFDVDRRYAYVDARRRNSGQRFSLTLDRCTGDILDALPDRGRFAGPGYGHYEPPRYVGRHQRIERYEPPYVPYK